MIDESKQVWVCRVRGRAYSAPGDPLEYFCMSRAGGSVYMKDEHKKAGCGVYEKADG